MTVPQIIASSWKLYFLMKFLGKGWGSNKQVGLQFALEVPLFAWT